MRRPLALAALLTALLVHGAVSAQTNNGTNSAAGTNNAAATNNTNNSTNNDTNNDTNNSTGGDTQGAPDEALRAKARDATRLLQERKHEEAEKLFLEIQAADPGYEEAMLNYAILFERTNRPDKAFALLHDIEKRHPTSPRPWLFTAGLYQRQKETAKALGVLQEAATRFPDDVNVQLQLAQTHEKGSEASIAAYRKVLALEPDHRGALNNLGVAYMSLHRYKDAIETLERYAKDNPMAANGQFNLATAYLSAGQLDKAQTVLQGLLSRRPREPFALSGIAVAYILGDKLPEADRFIAEHMAGDKLPAQLAYAVAFRQLHGGDIARAELLLTAAHKDIPANTFIALGLADALRKQGKLDAAEQLLARHASQVDAAAPTVRVHQALVKLDRKQPDAARAELDAAIKGLPDYTAPRDLRFAARVLPDDLKRLEELLSRAATPTTPPPARTGCGCVVAGRRAAPPLGLLALGALLGASVVRRRWH